MGYSRRFGAYLTVPPRYSEGSVIGLPRAAMVITNSERKSMYCPKKWWFRFGLGLDTKASAPLRFGAAFDEIMGSILEWYKLDKGVIFPLCGLDDCPFCSGDGCTHCNSTGDGVWKVVASEVLMDEDAENAIELTMKLKDAAEGWVRMYGRSMLDYKVVAVQPMIAVPVVTNAGKIYRSKVPVVKEEQGWRLARATDTEAECRLVTLPWYQLAKLDAIVMNRKDEKLWVWETKTSGSPERFSKDLHLDTQLPGYTRAAWYASTVLKEWGGVGFGGYVWDVTSSQKHSTPKILKSGLFSLAANQRVPSWAWSEALKNKISKNLALKKIDQIQSQFESVKLGKGSHLYATAAEKKEALKLLKEELAEAKNLVGAWDLAFRASLTDASLYYRQWGSFTPSQLHLYEVELFSDAKRLAKWLRALPGSSQLDQQSRTHVASNWPRVPLCRQPGGICAYTGPCLEDSFEARSSFGKRESLRWLSRK